MQEIAEVEQGRRQRALHRDVQDLVRRSERLLEALGACNQLAPLLRGDHHQRRHHARGEQHQRDGDVRAVPHQKQQRGQAQHASHQRAEAVDAGRKRDDHHRLHHRETDRETARRGQRRERQGRCVEAVVEQRRQRADQAAAAPAVGDVGEGATNQRQHGARQRRGRVRQASQRRELAYDHEDAGQRDRGDRRRGRGGRDAIRVRVVRPQERLPTRGEPVLHVFGGGGGRG